ncbi:glycosyltransferase family 2 protein [Botryobacter ruber]|uniref:glycosyltransferase family 2 protein n=1 Tax=Botryobacter ruber TaxID=2171629 RepID=UPI000E0C291F|nr:glycosyltransferase family 2 protein [Botryobacter ruber]
MPSVPKVFIILLNYKGWEDTIECLQSLQQLVYKNWSAIVIDNNSPNDSVKHLTDWAVATFSNNPAAFTLMDDTGILEKKIAPETVVTLIRSSHNSGFAAGNNLGIKLALQQSDCDYLWLLNNDTTVAANSLTELVHKAENACLHKQKTGIWGSKLLYYHQPDTLQAVGGKFSLSTFRSSHIGENQKDEGQFDIEEVKQDYVVGASMFVSRALVEDVGLLDESYFLYFEELDWATRARLCGYKLGFVSSSKIFHKEGKTIGSSSEGHKKSGLADFHGIRSKIIYIKKFYPQKLLRLYISLIASVILRIGRLQFKRARKVILLILKTN